MEGIKMHEMNTSSHEKEHLTYQRIDDIKMVKAEAGDDDCMIVNVDDINSQSEAENEVRKRLEDTNWWLQKSWVEKGLPKEQFTVNYGSGQLEIYNFNGELNKELLEELERTMAMVARLSDGKYIAKIRYILLDNVSEQNPNSGDAKWGERNRKIISLILTPEALSLEPHRIEKASVLLGTVLHETGHFVADDIKDDWIKRFGWKILEPPVILPGGRKSYYECLEKSRCVNDYAAYSPEEDIAESVAALMAEPGKLDSEKRQYLENILLSDKDLAEGNKIEMISRRGNDIILPEISSPVKYKAEKKKKFKITI